METDLQQKVQQRLAELPEDVRKAILSADMGKHLQELGAKHALHVDQIGALEDETLLVMLGFSDPGEFAGQLEQQAHLPAEEAQKLTEEISEQLFLPIRESMKRFMEARTQAVPTPESAPAAAAPSAAPPAPAEAVHALAAKPLELEAAEVMLTQQTVTPPKPVPAPAMPAASAAPTAPQPAPEAAADYKVDPYREPIE